MDFKEAWDDTCSKVSFCARVGRLKEMQLLLRDGASDNIADNRGWRPIHEAAAAPNGLECLEELLKQADVDVDCRTHEGETALLLACKRRNGDNADKAVEILLRYGANPNISDNEEETPLLVVVKNDNIEVVNRLLRCSADPNVADCSGWRPLHQAAMHGNLEILTALLAAGAKIDVQDECGMTPIFTASQHGVESCLLALLKTAEERGQTSIINMGAEDWATPLMIAAQQGYTSCVRMLLDYGADPNLRTTDNITALHLAVQCNQADCLKLLIQRMDLKPVIEECHPLAQNPNQFHPGQNEMICPLHLAVEWQSYACLQVLLSVGFSPDSIYHRTNHPVDFFLPYQHLRHETALSYAVHAEDRESVSILLKAGASCNAITPHCLHPAVRALTKPSPEMLKILLENGCDFNRSHAIPDANEIFLAAIVTQYHLEFVLQHGCDPQTCFGTGALDLFVAAVLMNADKNALIRVLQLIFQYVVVNEAVQKAYALVEIKTPHILSSDDRWEDITRQLGEPSPLKHICRMKIRHHMYSLHGPRFVHLVPRLLLPDSLQCYMLFRSRQMLHC